jgi:hypothetical protein
MKNRRPNTQTICIIMNVLNRFKNVIQRNEILLKILIHVQKAFAVETHLAEGITTINLISTRKLTWPFFKRWNDSSLFSREWECVTCCTEFKSAGNDGIKS